LDASARVLKIAGDGPLQPTSRLSNIAFLGRLDRSELSDFYRQSRCVVVPSLCHEAFGLVAAEAMSYGVPVIAADSGALPEVVTGGATGLLFRPGDVDELARKIKQLWTDPELCCSMGVAARRRVSQEFTEDIYYKRLLRAYEAAVETVHGSSMR
jgi:glycosyltransferase involved in cell wall biosynthesis